MHVAIYIQKMNPHKTCYFTIKLICRCCFSICSYQVLLRQDDSLEHHNNPHCSLSCKCCDGSKVCSTFCTTLGMLQSSPGKSCDNIYQINKASRGKSDFYWINTTSGVQEVYCNMELQCGGHKCGWTRVAQFDTSQGDPCPSGWTLITTPGANPKNVCRSGSANTCHSTIFTTNTSFYKICGQVRGYQKGNTNAFADVGDAGDSIDVAYVDGVSITLGRPRKHVWTYAIGILKMLIITVLVLLEEGEITHLHLLHGDHYYYESGDTGGDDVDAYYTTDPVWDGLVCSDSVNRCANPDMPWFFDSLLQHKKHS